ncbi:hypothetical protein [Amycolatopsis sp. NPDC059657]|uniref:hypothetical protein n=1 Tax=Amycolatopsis sp. NPDC059657 TaxID=3346899 RepID=UPI0036732DEB
MPERDSILGPMQAAVHHRLTELTRSVDKSDQDRLLVLASNEIPRLVAALREVLAEHEPDAAGRCPTCRRRQPWSPFRRRKQTPCRAYLAVRLRLDTDAVPTVAASHHKRRKRSPQYQG